MKHYIGIDVSKAHLEVDWLGTPQTYANEESTIRKLITALRRLNEKGELALVICEATGGYEQKVVRAVHEAKLPIHVAHANKVRHFARSKGLLAKTDRMDAGVLTDYGTLLKPAADVLHLNKTTEKIRERLRRREQLQADRKREQTRLDKELSKEIQKSIKEHINWLDQKIKKLDQELYELKQQDDVKTNHDLLTSIPAIGDLVAHYLLADLPEIGKLSHKALSALVGVAPFNHDSGKGQGKRFIQGGRSRLRQILYMSAIAAITFNQDLKAFYTRLKVQGKPSKVAIVAVIRKLLTMANSVIKRQVAWTVEYQRN